MITWLKKNGFTIALVIALIITVAALWQSCSKNTAAGTALANYQASLDSSTRAAFAIREQSDSLNKALASHDSLSFKLRDSLFAVLNGQKSSLKSAKAELQRLSVKLGGMIDTSSNLAISASYDSLVAELNRAYAMVGDYSNSSDTTIITMAGELTYKDSVIEVLQAEVGRLQTQLDKANALAESLLKDAQHAAKKSKIAAFFSKIRAELEIAAALIIAYLTLIKK